MDHLLRCTSCGNEFPPRVTPRYCEECVEDAKEGRIEIVPNLDTIDPSALPFATGDGPTTMWRYQDLLPVFADSPISLGEGWTPVTNAPRLSSWSGADLRIKNETVNPTWSFKDRFNALLLTNAIADGFDRFAVSTTGNHGPSTAAYASRAGCSDTVVLLHPDSQRPARIQTAAYGANSVVVSSGEGRVRLLEELVDRGWYPTTATTEMPAGLPYGYEGYKTIAFELIEQLQTVPAAVAVPTGSGDGLYGIWKGFRELAGLGVIDETPRMIATQPTDLSPLVEAFERGRIDVNIEAGTPPLTTSTASRIVCHHALATLEESSGHAVRVPEATLLEGIKTTARDGIMLEPASALATAGVKIAVEEGHVDRDETVVSVGTGSGIKWPDAMGPIVGEPATIDPEWSALTDAFELPSE